MDSDNIQTNKKVESNQFSTSVKSFYDSFKENVVLNATYYSYYTSLLSVVVLLFVFYCNYSYFTSGGFFWISIVFILVVFSAWQNTIMYLKL